MMPAAEAAGQMPWVPILMYHRVVPRLPQHDPARNCTTTAAFAAQLHWLAQRHYRAVTISELVASAESQRQPRVAITFDDGYEDNVIHALPVLKRYGFNATVFIVTDTMGGYNDFDAGIDGERVRMLSEEQIKLLASAGVEIGSHSCTHPASLVDLPDSELWPEVNGSRLVLEHLLGRQVMSFSYPHSRVSERVKVAVANAGYQSACAGVGTSFTPYSLSRVATSARSGPALEAAMGWRWLKHSVAMRRG